MTEINGGKVLDRPWGQGGLGRQRNGGGGLATMLER